MARVSIEDCLEKIQNRFDLVLLAAERTKQIMKGSLPLLEAKDNKEVVTALREVAAGKVRMGRSKPAVKGEAVEGKLPEA
jgi:DNA-directed RNA polymerase subunit omega